VCMCIRRGVIIFSPGATWVEAHDISNLRLPGVGSSVFLALGSFAMASRQWSLSKIRPTMLRSCVGFGAPCVNTHDVSKSWNTGVGSLVVALVAHVVELRQFRGPTHSTSLALGSGLTGRDPHGSRYLGTGIHGP
jgi:hypothetical protein